MEELAHDDDIDLDTLQSQIDLSLAHTQSLVSSWLEPKYGSSSSANNSRARNDEKEIEELLRRPPRLGVGAPIPATTGTQGREAMKLKNKLAGKKRQREEEDETQAARQSEDEEESRAGAIKKKARLDPFGEGKKKKKKEVGDVEVPPASSDISTVKDSLVAEVQTKSSSALQSPHQAQRSPEPSASKKKKKHKKSVGEEYISSGSLAKQDDQPPLKNNLSHSPSIGSSSMAQSSPSRPSAPSQFEKPAFPLLNLSGPPPDTGDLSSPSKKKRKRSKKKKKKPSAVDVGTQES